MAVAVNRLRLPIAAMPAAVVVSLLFGVLQAASSYRAETGVGVTQVRFDFAPLRPPVEVEPPVRPLKPKLEKPVEQPTTTVFEFSEDHGIDIGPDPDGIRRGLEREFRLPDGRGGDGVGKGNGTIPFGPRLSDRDPLAIVRVEPQYPPQAARRGLEGWVHVRFTITTAGTVEGAEVVKSSHGMFERAALEAVGKWKYQPQTKDGKPVEAQSETVLRFEMDQG